MKMANPDLPLGRHVLQHHEGRFPRVHFLILDRIHPSSKGGDWNKTLLQWETRWIADLGENFFPGLNKQISFRPFLEGFSSGGCEKEWLVCVFCLLFFVFMFVRIVLSSGIFNFQFWSQMLWSIPYVICHLDMLCVNLHWTHCGWLAFHLDVGINLCGMLPRLLPPTRRMYADLCCRGGLILALGDTSYPGGDLSDCHTCAGR